MRDVQEHVRAAEAVSYPVIVRRETPCESWVGDVNSERHWTDVEERVVLPGGIYARNWDYNWRYATGHSHFMLHPEPGGDGDQHFTLTNEGNSGVGPTVACGHCYGTEFRLYIGGYSVVAHCCACGHRAVVYDG